jgi:16S rRNA C967 or C1407 C5-methylase (RsmB/RsmF family)
MVRPGGRLVYGTCSWCVEENEDVFLSVTKQLSGDTGVQVQTHLHGSPEMDSDTMFSGTFTLPLI